MFTSGEFDAERFRYWQGQMLRSADLRDQTRMEAELRWWHNRALHQAYGVSNGLSVSREPDAGVIVAIRVECGLAYDCYGRALLLQNAREVSLPLFDPRIPRFTLLASYRQTSSSQTRNNQARICGAVEELELNWAQTTRVDFADGVPLAQLSYESSAGLLVLPPDVDFSKVEAGRTNRIRYDNSKNKLIYVGVMTEMDRDELLSLSNDDSYKKTVAMLFDESGSVPVLEPGFRPPASRALARPRVGSGATVPGDTPWEPWVEQISLGRRQAPIPIGMQVTVDTEAAGFMESPCYFAWLEGTLWDRSNIEFFPVPFTHVDRERIDSFRFRLWMPPITTVLGTRFRSANANFDAREHGLQVCWVGIQERPETEGCERVATPPCVTRPQA